MTETETRSDAITTADIASIEQVDIEAESIIEALATRTHPRRMRKAIIIEDVAERVFAEAEYTTGRTYGNTIVIDPEAFVDERGHVRSTLTTAVETEDGMTNLTAEINLA